MTQLPENPFNVTKAVDFTPQQISDFWVDIPGGAGFAQMVKPTSPMPMLILGAKGSGKTHLMRYFSFALQKIRHQRDPRPGGVANDGYLGVYLRCGGLNAARFAGKGEHSDTWVEVFAYYMELWLGQLMLSTAQEALVDADELARGEQQLYTEAALLFDAPPTGASSLAGLAAHLGALQRNLDAAINNAAIRGKLDVKIAVTRGKLIFGFPRLFAAHFPSLADCVFLYLIDEFENLSEPQQRYVNTLVREKEPPVSFKIGARTYGVRTYGTYSADEDNKEGSEFECIRLDDQLRQNSQYSVFAKRLVVRRLTESGLYPSALRSESELAEELRRCFKQPSEDRFSTEETAFVTSKPEDRERPYIDRLRRNLIRASSSKRGVRIVSPDEVEPILDAVTCPPFPLLEKANILLLYKEWRRRTNLRAAADKIRSECKLYIEGAPSGLDKVLSHFRSDLVAQLRRDYALRPRYLGIDTFIDMSWGVPRNLLVLLKHVYAWALFRGETPFRGRPVSYEAQEAGVLEAADWFFGDARMIGRDGVALQDAVQRLAELLKEIRYSDKPAECSCPAFSGDITRCDEATRRLVDKAVQWSLLIDEGEQRDRNTGRLDRKYQLNRMLAPRWDLPIYRRGVLALSPEEVDAVFQGGTHYAEVMKARIGRMTAPFETDAEGHETDNSLFRDSDV